MIFLWILCEKAPTITKKSVVSFVNVFNRKFPGIVKNLFLKRTENCDKQLKFSEVSPALGQDDALANPQDDYQKMRQAESDWIETHYDLNSINGINKIPVQKGLRCPFTTGVTGQLYYILRRKAYEHEKNGRMRLAVACMSKSSELAILDYGTRIQKQELYPLVRILARDGQVDEAIAEKEYIDRYCQEQRDILDKYIFQEAIESAKNLKTDFVIMSVHNVTCAECAKYQGRVYSISGKSLKFPKIPGFFYETGRVHPGCSHVFSPYIDGVDDPDLDYTLSCHPLRNRLYALNISVFSKRPFVDDRTRAARKKSRDYLAEQALKSEAEKDMDDNMIEYETKRGNDARNFFWLKKHIPGKCPKSLSGYRRMKTQNTRNYQFLKQFASEQGREI